MEVPRITCSLFGAIKAAATMRNTTILVHGPRGCVYHINYILGLRGNRHIPVYCTGMDEHDVVFGAEERLRQAILDLDEEKKPDILVVLSCCASGIIGEDVENACRTVDTRARVISIDAGGFEGIFTDGYAKTLKTIVAELAEPVHECLPGMVNIIGMLRAGPDLREIRRLLSLLGLTVGVVVPAGASLDRLRYIGKACLNIVVCETSGLEAAEYLRQRFGTPCIRTVFPVGAALSREFLHDVASALGISSIPPIPDCKSNMAMLPDPPRIALFSGPTRAIALGRFLSSQGIVPALIFLDLETPLIEEVRAAAGTGCAVMVGQGWDSIEDLIRAHDIDLLIGGLMERPIAAVLNLPLIDVMHGSQKTAGPDGGEAILELIRKHQTA